MLSNNTFLEARIQWLPDGLFFVEKGLGEYVQSMLKMNRFYFKQNICEETKENWELFLRSWFDKLTMWCQLIFYKTYYANTACTTYTFTFGKC